MLNFLICAAILVIVLIPVLCSTLDKDFRVRYPEHGGEGRAWLRRAAVWIRQKSRTPARLRSRDADAVSMAARLDPGLDTAKWEEHFQLRRIMDIYALILLAAFVCCSYILLKPPAALNRNGLARAPENGESRSQDVTATINGQKEELTIDIAPQEYSREEREALFKKVKSYIDEELPGQNKDLDNVKYPLNFVRGYPGENVAIQWSCDDYSLIGEDGTLGDLSDTVLPAETAVTAVITYSSYKEEYRKNIIITEYMRDQQEVLRDRLMNAIRQADQATKTTPFLKLPETAEGTPVTWSLPDSSLLPLILLLFAGLTAIIPVRRSEDLKKEIRERHDKLERSYPVFVHRMVLMLSAGMTVRRSWEILLADLKAHSGSRNAASVSPASAVLRRSGDTVDYLAREMHFSWLQMRSGISEIRVYREFGARIGQPAYEQFSQLLVQIIRKGRGGIGDMMLREAENAQRARRDTAKKLGETAETKLLLPMIILLTVVILIVMAPALLDM